jgi:hypothetical protein
MRAMATCRPWAIYANLVIAMIIPITTNTTIAICIQIQVGDIANTLAGAT